MKLMIVMLVCALAPGVGLAQPLPPRSTPLPAPVRQSVMELAKLCTESGGKPGRSPDIIKYADLSGDGATDFIVDAAAFNCDGAASAMSNGQSGSEVTVFVAGANNTATKAYSASVYGNRLQRSGPRQRLYVDVAAQLCGQRNAAKLPFASWEFCSRPLNWVAARNSFVLAPLSEKRAVPSN